MSTRTPKFVLSYKRVEVDIECELGDDVVVASAPATVAGSRLDMTGYTFRCQVRTDPDLTGGDTLLLSPSVSLYSSLSDSTLDQWQFVISTANTYTLGAGTFAWEIEWVPGLGGLNRTLAGGKLEISRETAHA